MSEVAGRLAATLGAAEDLRSRLAEECGEPLERAAVEIRRCLGAGGKVLLFGNGGSAADAQHVAAELVGRFKRDRAALAAVALTTDTSVLTAVGNDAGFDNVFARQIEALGRRGDVALGITTSGSSQNVLLAFAAARAAGLRTIALTGERGRGLADVVDIAIVVPSDDTARVQECHLLLEHVLCEALEAHADDGEIRSGGLIGWDELLDLRRRWRDEERTVVWTNGCFDLLHVGHVRSLQAARALGDVLVVGINSDDSVRLLKGPGRPMMAAADRAEVLSALGAVDFVVVFDDETPELALEQLQPDVHAKGADYAPPNGKPIPEREVVEAYGGRVEFLPLVEGISTTALTERITAGAEAP